MKQEITLKQVLEVIKEGEEYTCGSKRVALKNGCFEFWNDGIYCTNIIKVGQDWLFRKVEKGSE